jgi:dipeptidyl aminopeptidase/acylaminoacyl peptidase
VSGTSAPRHTAPCGAWPSPITADLVTSGALGLGQISVAGDDVYWIEGRPDEQGRYALVHRTPDGIQADVLPDSNARSRVHEYGGRSYAVEGDRVWFVEFADQRLYVKEAGAAPRALTPPGDLRYADMTVDVRRERLICVHEDHTRGGAEAVNLLVAVPFAGGAPRSLVDGADFYAAPRLSPDGTRLCWVSWNHPNMPWDGNELYVAEINADGSLGAARRVAGSATESIAQPAWSPGGLLHFISDRSGYWTPYRLESDGWVTPLAEIAAEFCRPAWALGYHSYAFISETQIACITIVEGETSLHVLDSSTGVLSDVATPFSDMGTYLWTRGNTLVMDAASPQHPRSVVAVDIVRGTIEVYRRSFELSVDGGYISVPEAIEFPTEGGLRAHAFYYAPCNRDVVTPAGERPPLLVRSHGGPTAATDSVINLEVQYWTSRGIAIVDVNYGGSTGYGRAYRERLDGQWGVVDVDDCVNAARYLVERGDVDGDRLLIDGGSAGGYTTLCALTFRDVFAAGASHFGVGDLTKLAHDTHKFESRYLERLVGPYPERADLYEQRSPINFVDRLSCPVILFQGLEDEVVPPNQAEMMFAALRSKGIPCAYIAFAGEQHGFRKAENIRRALEGELYFFSRVFGFELADAVEPVPIENLERRGPGR